MSKQMTEYTMKDNTYVLPCKIDVHDTITIEIGDSKTIDKFIPQLKIMRWDNEVNLSVRLIHDEKDANYELVSNIIKWKGLTKECNFYEITEGDGGYELEVIINELPPINKIEFTLNTKGLVFFYQPPLNTFKLKKGQTATETHIYNKDGSIKSYRPENVVGSYAIYHNGNPINYVDGKLYRTGKFGHIYRPKVIDSAGNWIWGNLIIDKELSILTIEIPQEFLENAIYPVIVDPTFGNTGTQASHDHFYGPYTVGVPLSQTSPTGTNTLNSLSFLLDVVATILGRYALYSTSGVAPTTRLIRDTDTWDIIGGTGVWRTNPIDMNYSLASSTQYHAGIYFGAMDVDLHYDTGAYTYSSYQVTDDTPNPFGGSEDFATCIYSAYATYTGSGGGLSIPIAMNYYKQMRI